MASIQAASDMAVEFTDLVPATPPASGGMFDDLIPKQTGPGFAAVGNEFGDLAVPSWAQGEPVPAGTVAPSARPASPPSAEGAPPPGDTQLTTDQLARERALTENANQSGYFALEPKEPGFTHLLWSLGAPFAAIGQTALGERPVPTGVGALEMAAPLAGMGDLRFGPPRVSPMMEAFNQETAAREAAKRFGPPEPPTPAPLSSEPPDPTATSGIARVHGQIGLGPEPPPPSPVPAEAVPPGVPPGTEVPTSLRLGAAIDAAGSPRPGFVPQTNVDPVTGQVTPVRVPPGAAGPETVPYARPASLATLPDHPLMDNFNQGGPMAAQQPGAPLGPEALVSSRAPGAAPGPQSAGAAASRDMTSNTSFGRTAREIKGAEADKEFADLMRTPQPGDARDIIPGATQTKAEIELSPGVSREAKGLRQEFREGFNDHEKANNEVYHNWIDDVVPPREQVATMKDLREDRWTTAEKTVFGADPNGQPVSTASVVDHMKAVLADPVNKANSYLKNAFKPFLDALTDDNGNPITMGAKELYGQRQEMRRKVKDMATNPDLAHVRGEFGDLMDTTDNTITGVAPKFRTMMDDYKAHSEAINAAERLADIKLKVTNGSDRVITFGAFDRFMKSLWMERHGPNAYAPAKSIPQTTWDHLMTLHERLARSASADELAKTKGSDTTQLMMEMARKGAIGAAHVVAAKVAPGIGNIAVPYITKQIDARIAQKKIRGHLDPDLSKYPPVVP